MPDFFLRSGVASPELIDLAPDSVALTLEAAYRALARSQQAEPMRWGGWKLGGTNHASRKAFCVDHCYYGSIDHQEILVQPTIAPGFSLTELKGEVEIALRLDGALTGYDAWCVALEMPSTSLRNLSDLGLIALVSDRCAAGALVLGSAHPGPLPSLVSMRFIQRINGHLAAEATSAALVDRPEILLQDFLALARHHDAPLMPGQWIATGGITPCMTYAYGDRVEVVVDEEIVLDVVIKSSLS